MALAVANGAGGQPARFTGQEIGMNGTIVLTGHLVDVSV
jgi:hypothetical protein